MRPKEGEPCPDCRRPLVIVHDWREGETLCKSCGIVLEHHMIEEKPRLFRMFADDDRPDPSHHGGPTPVDERSGLRPPPVLSTVVSARGTDGRMLSAVHGRSLKKARAGARASASASAGGDRWRATIEAAMRVRMGADKGQVEWACQIHEAYVRAGNVRRADRCGAAAAVAAWWAGGQGHDQDEVAEIFEVGRAAFSKCVTDMTNRLGSETMEAVALAKQQRSADALLERVVASIGAIADDADAWRAGTLARDVAQCVRLRSNRVDSEVPPGACVAIAYRACRLLGLGGVTREAAMGNPVFGMVGKDAAFAAHLATVDAALREAGEPVVREAVARARARVRCGSRR